MKQFFSLVLLVAPLAGMAQALTNDGTTISVQAGTTLYVVGGVLNKAGSTLSNAGTVQLTGDLTNAGTLTSAGVLRFSGAASQTFAPGTTTVASLTQSNTGAAGQNTLNIPADLIVGTALTLTSGLVRTAPAATITLPDGATLTGEAPGRYVQGTLRVVRASGSGLLDFGHGITLDRTGLGQVAVTRTAGLLTNDLSRATSLGISTQTGIDRIWTVEAATPAAPVAVALQWLPDDDNGIASFAQAQAWRAPVGSAAWAAASAVQAATVTASSRSFTFATAALGRLTVGAVTAPLPVELTRFTAEPRGDDALLKWATASEKNNDHFDVEASADGQRFTRIGRVAGHGSTTQPQEYQLLDKAIARYAADPVYYRLRQVDINGTESFSPVRTVRVAIPLGLATEAWPQPFGTTGLTVALRTATAGPATLLVLDGLGRTVLSRTLDLPAGATAVPLAELGLLNSGVYVLRVRQSSQQAQLKLVRE